MSNLGSCEIKQMCRHVQSEDQQAGNAMFLGFRMAVNLTQTGEHGGPIMHASRLLSTDSIPFVHKDWLEFTETPGRDPRIFYRRRRLVASDIYDLNIWKTCKNHQKPFIWNGFLITGNRKYRLGWQQQLIADLSLKEDARRRWEISRVCGMQHPGISRLPWLLRCTWPWKVFHG